MKLKTLPITSFLLIILGAAWIFFSQAPADSVTAGRIPAPQKGFLAPDFSLPDGNGVSLSLSDLRGQPVLLNIWTSWCPPCQAEMPAMQKVYSANAPQGFTILAVNATNQDKVQDAQAFIKELGLTFPILYDATGKVSNLYQVRALPTSFFIDADGMIREVVVGGPMSEALLEIRVRQLLESVQN